MPENDGQKPSPAPRDAASAGRGVPSKREWLEAYVDGLEREGYTGEVMILAHFNRGELTKVRVLTEDK